MVYTLQDKLPSQEHAQFTVQNVPPNFNAEDREGVCCKDCDNYVQRPYWACCDCSGESLN